MLQLKRLAIGLLLLSIYMVETHARTESIYNKKIIPSKQMGYSYAPNTKYYIARINREKKTIQVILDGDIYPHDFKEPRVYNNVNMDDGQRLNTPTYMFEKNFVKTNKLDIVGKKIINEAAVGEDLYAVDAFKADLPLKETILIIEPSVSGNGYQRFVTINAYYYAKNNVVMDTELYLETDVLDDIDKFKQDYVVAVFCSKSSKKINDDQILDYNMTTPVRNKYNSIKKAEQISIKEDRNESYIYDTKVQALFIREKDGKLGKRFLITSYKGHKDFISKSYYLDEPGNELTAPVEQSYGALTNPLGVIRDSTETDLTEILVYEKKSADYSGGFSLLKADKDGILREILFFEAFICP